MPSSVFLQKIPPPLLPTPSPSPPKKEQSIFLTKKPASRITPRVYFFIELN